MGSGLDDRVRDGDAEIVREARRLLRDYERTRAGSQPSEKTEAEYAKAVRRMRKRNLLPETMAGTKSSYYYLRAALLWMAASKLREHLPTLINLGSRRGYPDADDAWMKAMALVRAAVEAMRKYPPGEPEILILDGKRCPWAPEMMDPSMRRERRPNDVEYKQQALPEGWMEEFWAEVETSRTKYADAVAVQFATGCRPEELKKGTVVASDGIRLRIFVKGAKTNRGHGTRLLCFRIDSLVHPWHRHLAESAELDGRTFGRGSVSVLDVSIGNVRTYGGIFANLAENVGFWRPDAWKASKSEPAGFRDAFAAVLTARWPAEKVAAGVWLHAEGSGFVLSPSVGRGRPVRVENPTAPWERHVAKLAATAGAGGVLLRRGDVNGFVSKVQALKASSPLATLSPYVVRHAIAASRKAELRLDPERAAAMSKEERAEFERQRLMEVAKTLGHSSTKTQSAYGSPWASKGSTGITAVKGGTPKPPSLRASFDDAPRG